MDYARFKRPDDVIHYFLLTKPKIVLGNLAIAAAAFLLGAQDRIDLRLFAATLIGLALIIASSCVFNNYIDRNLDQKMKRTQNRVLAIGLIPVSHAILFGCVLGLIGNLVLYLLTNLLTVLVADGAFLIYVFVYGFCKTRTIYGTAIGSLAGAAPPVVGYCASKGHLDAAALILFAMMVLWQMPHFWAIAVFRLDDYTAAGIPILPVKKGILRTKIETLFYVFAFIFSSFLLTLFGFTGSIYLIVMIAAGSLWLGMWFKRFKSSPAIWGLSMFRQSLFSFVCMCLAIAVD